MTECNGSGRQVVLNGTSLQSVLFLARHPPMGQGLLIHEVLSYKV